jgi:hypothetical protein
MNDLLWLANHPLRGNVMGIPTSRDPDTPEGLESRLFVRIHRISPELLHSTELKLEKLHRIWTDSDRAFVLELLWPSEPRLSLSLLYKEWIWEHYRKLNLTFFTLSTGRSTGVFIGWWSWCFDRKWDSGGPTCQDGRPVRVAGWLSFMATPTWALDTPCTDLP